MAKFYGSAGYHPGAIGWETFERMAKAFAPLAKLFAPLVDNLRNIARFYNQKRWQRLSLDQLLIVGQQSRARSQIKQFRKRQKWIQRARGNKPLATYFRYRDLIIRQIAYRGRSCLALADISPESILTGNHRLSPLPKSAFLGIG